MSGTAAVSEVGGKPAGVSEVAEHLRRAISEGIYRAGERLPTIRELSSDLDLAPHVVTRAFTILQAEGLVVSRKKAGTFVKTGGGPAERSESRRRLRVFALVGPELSHGFYPSLQRGFDDAALEKGYQIIASDTENDVSRQANIILQLMDKSVSGVALVPSMYGPSQAHQIRQLQNSGVPVVLVHRGIEGVEAPLIRIPFEAIGRAATQRIVDAGHTRIAFCSGAKKHTDRESDYTKGFRAVCDEAGLSQPESFVHFGSMTRLNTKSYSAYEQEYEAWFREVMAREDRPTAILTTFETTGEMAYLTAIQQQIRVPEELSIVTVGGRERHGMISRHLTCVALHEARTGAIAADLLDQMQSGRMPIHNNHTVDIDFTIDAGRTLSAPPA